MAEGAKAKDDAISYLEADIQERDDTILEVNKRNEKLTSDMDFLQNKMDKIEEDEV